MRILLDTCTFLWITADSPELSADAKRLFTDRSNEVFLSVISAWEISVKHALGKLPLPEPPQQFVPRQRAAHGAASLPLDEMAVLQLPGLPQLHKDPFDRMLVCQAIAAGLTLLTPDAAIRAYSVPTMW
jgi:PIN domain nuclease of toxin-antitoxin system